MDREPACLASSGVRANAAQIALLVLANVFVGATVGVERSILPLLAEREFGLAAGTAALAYVATFGAAKAATNLVAGRFAEVWGRKRVLVAGWLVGLPVPLLLMWAPVWGMVVVANVLLGASQGLAWSMTVNMKVDMAGPRRRGLVVGLNEAAGYGGVGVAAFLATTVATGYGLRPWPFMLALVAVLGLGVSLLFVRDTSAHVAAESQAHPELRPALRRVFAYATLRDSSLQATCLAGLVNNLNDGVAWGLLPLVWAAQGLDLGAIGLLAAAYPLVWSVGQVGTGPLSDRLGRKPLVVGGMLVQAAGVWGALLAPDLPGKLLGVVLLGAGTAMAYPTLLAAAGDAAAPAWRASTLGVYRFWRDAGFVVGALGAGWLAELLSPAIAVHATAALTLLAGLFALVRLRETAGLSVRRFVRQSGVGSATGRSRGEGKAWL